MRVLFSILSLLAASTAFSQTTYVERLMKQGAGEGSVVLHQDAKITQRLNSDSYYDKAVDKNADAAKPASALKNAGKTASAAGVHRSQHPDSVGTPDSAAGEASTPARRYKADGFRIQIYAGNNSRKSRVDATAAGQRIKGYFPELPVYTHFYPPRWVCRVGDFRTAEEAREYLQQIRKLNAFPSATVIKTTVQLAY